MDHVGVGWWIWCARSRSRPVVQRATFRSRSLPSGTGDGRTTEPETSTEMGQKKSPPRATRTSTPHPFSPDPNTSAEEGRGTSL